MIFVLLVKSLQSKKPAAIDSGDELTTEEKLIGILEERVCDAGDDDSRERAELELARFRKVARRPSIR